jgi:type IV secretion system protein VirD4
MSATKILWGQVLAVFAIVLAAVWGATQWTAAALGYQAGLGAPWFMLGHIPIYSPPSFFWWWFSYDAYVPAIFLHGAYIAASGGLISIVVAIAMSSIPKAVWSAATIGRRPAIRCWWAQSSMCSMPNPTRRWPG